jgi:multidrug efflux pump subunit AcrA (membrane-fusion protein)
MSRLRLSLSVVFAAGSLLAQDNAPLPSLTVASSDVVRTTTQPAEIVPYFEARLGTKVSGSVKAIHFDIGDSVKKGDVLLEIDAPELIKARDAYAAVADAERATMAETEAEVNATKAAAEAAKSEYERMAEVVKSGVVSPKARDEAEQRYKSAQAGVQKARAQLASVNAAVRVAEARMAEAQAMLDYATLQAPFDGVVTRRGVDEGEFITVGENNTDMLTVSQMNPVRVVVHVPETDARLLDKGDPVRLNFSSLAAGEIEGQVTRTTGRLDARTRVMTAEVELANDGGELLPGAFGSATIQLAEEKGALMLPSGAIRVDEKGGTVAYVVRDGKVAITPVTLGIDDGIHVQVSSGLKVGDVVIGASLGRLEDGQAVTVAPAP